MDSGNVIEKLLELFDKLSNGFHQLNNTCETLKTKVESTDNCSTEIKNTIQNLHNDTVIIKQLCGQLDRAVRDLTSYKDNIQNIPRETFDLLHTVRSEILDQNTKVNDFSNKFGDSYFKKIHSSVTKEELTPVIKLSKLLVTPVGIISFFILFTLGMMATSLGIYKIFQLGVPAAKPVIQKVISTNTTNTVSGAPSPARPGTP